GSKSRFAPYRTRIQPLLPQYPPRSEDEGFDKVKARRSQGVAGLGASTEERTRRRAVQQAEDAAVGATGPEAAIQARQLQQEVERAARGLPLLFRLRLPTENDKA